MPQEIEITPAAIALAEQILLPPGKVFDNERIVFIKNLCTFDLHAVPGSGKTTALLAKLIALEQNLPFEDGSGMLVLSHTNAAVDEIRLKIGHICPRLFNYPSFVGTIQSFTDVFLTIPYYKTLYHKRPVRIDDDIYMEQHYPDYKLKTWLGNRGDGKKLLYDFRLRDGDILNLKLTDEAFPFQKRSSTYQKILEIKKKIREDGFLCFDDAYILATEYLVSFPRIINIINKRFKYVFVDEMQDMDVHQYDLLEKLFAGAAHVGYQRIGDKNQAIYTNDAEHETNWTQRNVKELNGSHRLHPLVAAVVQPLAVSPINIAGQQTYPDGQPINIKPILYVFDNDNKDLVIETYAMKIKDLIDKGEIDTAKPNVYKAIGWTTRRHDDRADSIKLNDYYSSYSKDQQKLKINYDCLESYLYYYSPGVNLLASIRKSLLNGLLKVLRLEDVLNPMNKRTFTKRTLIEYLHTHHQDVEDIFKSYVYKIVKQVAEGNKAQGLVQFNKLIKATLRKLGVTISKSKSFIDGKHTPSGSPPPEQENLDINQYIKEGVAVDICTVHSVKGQTHTCTLYLETFYQRNVNHKGQYESSRIADQLHGIVLPADAHKYIKQSLKMTYVGFSRPTHLLAFAIHQTRYNSHYVGKAGMQHWDVQFIRSKNNKETT